MNALVTGASGFAGQWLIRRLLQSEETVWGAVRTIPKGAGERRTSDVGRRTGPGEPEISHPPSSRPVILTDDELRAVHWRTFSLEDPEQLDRLLSESRPQAVYHLAGISSPHESYRDPAGTFRVNVLGTIHLLEAVRRYKEEGHNSPRVLLVGSGQEYGRVKPEALPLTEEAPLDPVNPYSASKAAQELVGRQYGHAFALPILMTRSFNHIGPGQNEGFSVSHFARTLVRIALGQAQPVLKVGNLSARRDFTDVRDAVEAYRLLMEQGRPGEVYNVCTGRMESMEDILQHLIRLSGVTVEIQVDPERLRPADEPMLQGSPAKLQRETGWTPQLEMDQTLMDLLESNRQQIQQEIPSSISAS